MNLIRRLFPFRTCTIEIKEGKRALARPCLLYHIKRCQGPCIEAISKDAYRADIDQVMLFLEGRQEQVAKRLKTDMIAASDATDYERAAALRDKVKAIERTMESQKMAAFARADTDVLGYARQGAWAAVQLFAIRDGKTVARDVFVLENVGEGSDDEAMSAFVKQYYAATSSIPPRVFLPRLPGDTDELVELLETRRGKRGGSVRAATRRGPGPDGACRSKCRRDAGP
jgi:excinuclease ABC subunit C